MRSKFRHLRWGFAFLLLFLMANCILNQGLKKPQGEEEFFQETSRLEKVAREDPEPTVRAQSHLQLAFLYVDYRNPQLSYPRALQELERCLSLSPEQAKPDRFWNWLLVLREIDHLRQDVIKKEEKSRDLQTQIEKLQISLEKAQEMNRSLREEVTSLKGTNNKMTEIIERLKSLDRQLEEKRSLFK